MGWFQRLFDRSLKTQVRAAIATSDMPKVPFARPPADWSDEHGWDAFHAATPGPPRHSPIDLGLQYVASFRDNGFRRIWFPGAGTSAGPRAFAELGFEVVSTDFSTAAVAAQEQLARAPLEADLGAFGDAGSDAAPVMQVLKHDFRKPLDVSPFDVVLNRRAFQGLSSADRAAAARAHHDALRAGGWAMFETMNVAVELRDALEDSLVDVGFVLPLHETHRWYRAALAATGITFVIILGRALVPGQNPSKRDQARLDALTAEFQERAKREAEQTALASADARVAHVIYSTG
jgi:hypothetical protein